MAEYTENLELIKPSESELMGASREFYNGDMDILDEAISAIREALGGISIIRTDQAAYDSEEHSSNDLYLCADTGHIYLGDTQMGGGGGGGAAGETAILSLRGIASDTVGIATQEE